MIDEKELKKTFIRIFIVVGIGFLIIVIFSGFMLSKSFKKGYQVCLDNKTFEEDNDVLSTPDLAYHPNLNVKVDVNQSNLSKQFGELFVNSS